MLQHDVRLTPVPIRSKVNVESDALSRQDWVTFARSVGMPKAKARALARRDVGAMQMLQQGGTCPRGMPPQGGVLPQLWKAGPLADGMLVQDEGRK